MHKPVTSAEEARQNSLANRTTMLDVRLSNLSALSVYSVTANTVDLERVIDTFASKYPNCRIQLEQ